MAMTTHLGRDARRDVHGLDCKDWMQTNAHEEERCKPHHDLKFPAVYPFPFHVLGEDGYWSVGEEQPCPARGGGVGGGGRPELDDDTTTALSPPPPPLGLL
ncbi:hypothetical protein ACQJBY_040525 [Aegilops geniculata]